MNLLAPSAPYQRIPLRRRFQVHTIHHQEATMKYPRSWCQRAGDVDWAGNEEQQDGLSCSSVCHFEGFGVDTHDRALDIADENILFASSV
ncbi:hypothetical protein Hypma_000034 [Hypsizygus marmoreus]|uniref:Uncharacterized protein n=1 Tax=Hypsizygus marmoreus TaxID=39966 RepID=A0A369KEG6_HYPMA|nr:hypothetical protein Hypma_000034 [Hypsizygus marmoreus]